MVTPGLRVGFPILVYVKSRWPYPCFNGGDRTRELLSPYQEMSFTYSVDCHIISYVAYLTCRRDTLGITKSDMY